jgi:hypothetical protein
VGREWEKLVTALESCATVCFDTVSFAGSLVVYIDELMGVRWRDVWDKMFLPLGTICLRRLTIDVLYVRHKGL